MLKLLANYDAHQTKLLCSYMRRVASYMGFPPCGGRRSEPRGVPRASCVMTATDRRQTQSRRRAENATRFHLTHKYSDLLVIGLTCGIDQCLEALHVTETRNGFGKFLKSFSLCLYLLGYTL